MGNLFSSIDEDTPSTLSNHSGSFSHSGIPPEAVLLREEALQLMFQAKAAAKQSQSEYQFGSKAQAKLLSDKKKRLYTQMNEKNRQAAELIFKHFNQNHPNHIIDLHGLYVSEALKYLEHKLVECRSNNIPQLKVITGMGNNSPEKIAKIKPKVEEYVRENRLKVACYDGHIMIDVSPVVQYRTTNYQSSNECILL